MNPILKNILAVVGGWFIGSVVNMSLIMLGPIIIANPEGFDNSNMDVMAETIHLLQPINYLFPFLAHALGTLVGSFLAAKIAVNRKMIFAFVMGGLFMLGGIVNVIMLPGPMWFNIVDLILAYIPMSWLALRIVKNS